MEVHKTSVRKALQSRRGPYWGPPLSKGRYVGGRKLGDRTCPWVVRLRDEEGKQRYRALGQITAEFDYDAAKRVAGEWFKNFDAGVSDTPATVERACRDYVEHLEADGRGARSNGDRRKDASGVPGWGAAHDI